MKKSIRILLIFNLIIGFSITSCKTQINVKQNIQGTMLKYADGNGNTYIITFDSIKYIAVKPIESSSGIYSGGSDVQKSISTEVFNLLNQEFEKIINNKSIHIQDRIMGSGMLTISEPNSNQKVAIIQSCTEKDNLEKLLSSYTKK